jgi:hypothetical protein
MKRTPAIFLLFCGVAASAHAQNAPTAFVQGFGGVTFMSETATVFGAGAGVRVHEHFELIGEFGRLTNVLPRHLQEDLDDAARAIGTLYGGPLTIDGKAPAVYGLGVLRVSHYASPRLKLFLEGGGGVARGVSDITARAGRADVSSEVTRALGIKDHETAPLLAVGGGVSVPLNAHLALDLGYRYMRIFTDDPRINTGTMSAGIRWGF